MVLIRSHRDRPVQRRRVRQDPVRRPATGGKGSEPRQGQRLPAQTVGALFRAARRSQELSQEQLAALTRGRPGRVSRAMISAIERGVHLPGLEVLLTLAHALLSSGGQSVSPGDPVLLGAIGGVLSGAVFGDHCSPISDTTVLSSQSSGCDHIAHVWTQMPYAVVVAAVCIGLGTVPLGFGWAVWALLPAQLLGIAAAIRILGQPVES